MPQFSTLTITTLLSWLRDGAVIGGVLTFGWKVRGVYQGVADFVERITEHMDAMEDFAKECVENHLKHIERDLARLSGRDREE